MNNELVNQQQALLNKNGFHLNEDTTNSLSSPSSMPNWLQTIIDSSHLITFCVSISVIIYGSFRSLNIDKENESYTKQQNRKKISHKKKVKIKKSSALASSNANGNINTENAIINNLTSIGANEKEKLLLNERDENDNKSLDSDLEYEEVDDENDDELNQLSSKDKDDENEHHHHQSIQNIDSAQALFIPIAASISLLLMFFFFDSIQTAFVICTSILATVAFSFLLSPVCKVVLKYFFFKLKMSNHLINKRFSCCFMGKFTLAEMIAFVLSSLLVCLWIVTGHWLLMDLIGVGFCVTFIAMVRLPSLKVSTLLLVGLVIYDVLWVYFSHLIFSSNVMIKVATKEADNPMNVIARKFNIETQFSKDSPKLSLPGKLVVPSYQRTGNFSILGLGDIVVPGLLLCFVLRFDAYKRSKQAIGLKEAIDSKTISSENSPNNKTSPLLILQTCKFKNEDCYECNKFSNNQYEKKIKQDQPRKINLHKKPLNLMNDIQFNIKQYCCCNGNGDCLNCKLNDFTYFEIESIINSSLEEQIKAKEQIETDAAFALSLSHTSHAYSLKNLLRLHNVSYFHCSLLGYFVGLITATLSSEIFKEAQPALLYLVPFTLLPLLTMAYLKGDLRLMWNEPFSLNETTNHSQTKYFYV